MKKLFLILFFFILNTSLFTSEEIALKQALYALKEGEKFKEITADILDQETLPTSVKQTFIQQKRRFFVFWYPSEGLKIKSLLSFVEGNKEQPLILMLRGASRMEALPTFLYPAKEILFCKESDATIVVGCYRDGVSEGIDEYGGDDVNDVYQLTLHLSEVFDDLNIKPDKKRRYMIGISRGSLQMFLALSKFPDLSSHFSKFVSLSGILNIDLFATNNPQWRRKMEKDFAFDGYNGLDTSDHLRFSRMVR
jgi:predicted peptidase